MSSISLKSEDHAFSCSVVLTLCRTHGAKVEQSDDSALIIVSDFKGKFVEVSVRPVATF